MGGREEGRVGGSVGGREGGSVGGREGGSVGGREGGREGEGAMGRTDCYETNYVQAQTCNHIKFGQHGTLPPRMCLKRENILKGWRKGGGRETIFRTRRVKIDW